MIYLKNYVLQYNTNFAFYIIICKWKLHFSDTIVSFKSDTWMGKSDDFYLGDFVLSKTKYFERRGHKFSHLSERNITFITDLRNMTYEHYLNQKKSMFQWKLKAILAKNPELIEILANISHPIIGKY